MLTAEAVQEVLWRTGLSKYALAKSLGLVSSTSINQYLRGTRMSAEVADRFFNEYEIVIDDTFYPSNRTS